MILRNRSTVLRQMFIALHPQCAVIGLWSLCIRCSLHSFTCSRKQFEVIGNYSFFVAHGGHKCMDMASNYPRDVASKRDSVGTKEPKVSQEIFHDKIPASRAAPDLLIWGRIDPAFHVAFTLWVLSLCKLNIFFGVRWKTSAAVVRQGSRFKRKTFFCKSRL